MLEWKSPEGEVFVTPLECTACRHFSGEPKVIAAVYSMSRETNKALMKPKINILCLKHHREVLDRVGLKE